MGMESGQIPDSALKATTEVWLQQTLLFIGC